MSTTSRRRPRGYDYVGEHRVNFAQALFARRRDQRQEQAARSTLLPGEEPGYDVRREHDQQQDHHPTAERVVADELRRFEPDQPLDVGAHRPEGIDEVRKAGMRTPPKSQDEAE